MDGNNRRYLPDKRKGMQSPGKIENVKKKIYARRGKCFSMGYATLSGPMAVDRKSFEAAAKNSTGEKGEQTDK